MSEQRPDRPARKPGRPGPGNGSFRFRNGLLGWLLFIGLAVMLVLLVKSKANPASTEIPVGDFMRLLEEDKVETVRVEDPDVSGKLSNEQLLPNVSGAGTKKILHYKTTFPQNYIANQGF